MPFEKRTVMEQKEDERIYLRADETLDYAVVMDILGAMNRSGFKKVALISKPVTNSP
jgi:biopolymer transport protein TolR